MARSAGKLLCLLLPFTSSASADDAAALLQVHASMDAMVQGSSDVGALRSLLATARAELLQRVAQAQSTSDERSGNMATQDIQQSMKEATKFVQSALANKTTTGSNQRCSAMCVIGIILDSLAIGNEVSMAFSDGTSRSCPLGVLIMWFVVGIATLRDDQDLDFPEAVHMMTQQFTSVGYGSSTPDPQGLKIFHGLHGVLSQMSVARVISEAMGWVLDLGGDSPGALAVQLGVTLIASTAWFMSDLHSGNKTKYPGWADALLDGFYQALITMTTIGYGDLKLTTDWGKRISPVGMPLLTNAFARFAAATPSTTKAPEPLPPKRWSDLEMFQCPAASMARKKLLDAVAEGEAEG